MSSYINPYVLLDELSKLLSGVNDPVLIDKWLKEQPNIDLENNICESYGYALSMLQKIIGTRNYFIFNYLLTNPSYNVNICAKRIYRKSNEADTPIHNAIDKILKVYVERLLADFLNYYNSSENEKIITQKVAKLIVDCCFVQSGFKRIDYELIDTIFGGFESIWEEIFPGILNAVRTGDLDRLESMENLENVKKYWFCERETILLLFLTLEAIEYSNQHLISYLCKQIFKLYTGLKDEDFVDNNYNMDDRIITNSSMSEYISTILDILMELNNTLAIELTKKLILIGLKPSNIFKYNIELIDDQNFECVNDKIVLKEVAEEYNTSSILCVFTLLFHKYIYLDEDNMYNLIQIFIGEGLLFGI